jgi:hypothetical protein
MGNERAAHELNRQSQMQEFMARLAESQQAHEDSKQFHAGELGARAQEQAFREQQAAQALQEANAVKFENIKGNPYWMDRKNKTLTAIQTDTPTINPLDMAKYRAAHKQRNDAGIALQKSTTPEDVALWTTQKAAADKTIQDIETRYAPKGTNAAPSAASALAPTSEAPLGWQITPGGYQRPITNPADALTQPAVTNVAPPVPSPDSGTTKKRYNPSKGYFEVINPDGQWVPMQ